MPASTSNRCDPDGPPEVRSLLLLRLRGRPFLKVILFCARSYAMFGARNRARGASTRGRHVPPPTQEVSQTDGPLPRALAGRHHVPPSRHPSLMRCISVTTWRCATILVSRSIFRSKTLRCYDAWVVKLKWDVFLAQNVSNVENTTFMPDYRACSHEAR